MTLGARRRSTVRRAEAAIILARGISGGRGWFLGITASVDPLTYARGVAMALPPVSTIGLGLKRRLISDAIGPVAAGLPVLGPSLWLLFRIFKSRRQLGDDQTLAGGRIPNSRANSAIWVRFSWFSFR